MNIFLRELKANLKSLLIWSVVMGLLVMVGVSKYASFAGDTELLGLLDAMPQAMMDALRMNSFNLSTLEGFFGIMFIYFSLMGAMAAAMWGSETITKEARNHTSEFSHVLPVSRNRLVSAKALSALVYCIVFVGVTWGLSLAAVQPYTPGEGFYRFLALEMAGMLLIEVIFLAVGLLLACALQHSKRAGGLAIGIILGLYFLSVVSELQPDLAWVDHFTPFKYYDPLRMLQTGQIETLPLLLTGGIVLACTTAAFWFYNRRDLTI